MVRRSTTTGLTFTLCFLLTFAACRGQSPDDRVRDNVPSRALGGFQGTWTGTGGDIFFDLDLVQDGQRLSGQHCGTTSDAARTDCAMDLEDEPSVTGTIDGEVANVTFVSAYSGATGRAVIALRGDSLTWEITERPDDEFYLPTRATLYRTGADPESSGASSNPKALRARRARVIGAQEPVGVAVRTLSLLRSSFLDGNALWLCEV